jgi:1-acyl-sn-glycerol-3-phosphate acyltransferase
MSNIKAGKYILNLLLSSVVGGVLLLLFSLNTILCCSVLLLFAFIKLITPNRWIKRKISIVLTFIASIWIEVNSFFFRIFQNAKWDVKGLEHLPASGSFLLVSNHRSWADIFVLQHIFKRRIPFLKFFLKKELIWVPFLGLAWWALDFPFLKRYSRKFLEKHPELRGKDMETTRKYCEKFKNIPVSIMNFLEGTRFNFQKHKKQNTPYRHLLLPKAGGVALVFSSMGDYLSNILDVTIVYPKNKPPVNFWDLLTRNIPHITVRVKTLSIPENVVGMNYQEDKAFRNKIQQWANQLWQKKDHQIEAIMIEYNNK